MSSRSKQQRGYSLVEVLVAFVILAMALTVLLRIFSSGLRNVDAAADYARAVVIANTQMAAPGSIESLESGESEGEIERRFHWVRNISQLDPETLLAGDQARLPAYRISVEVEWNARGGTRRVAFDTIRLDDSPTRERRR